MLFTTLPITKGPHLIHRTSDKYLCKKWHYLARQTARQMGAAMVHTDKTKGAVWGSQGSHSDISLPFWPERWNPSSSLGAMHSKQNVIHTWSNTNKFLFRVCKMAPQGGPIKYGRMAPSRRPLVLSVHGRRCHQTYRMYTGFPSTENAQIMKFKRSTPWMGPIIGKLHAEIMVVL